ncbi:MAG TPA: AAA family ATPase, partial [Vicinamibacterales bacterium]|nr:AAA family ATPase [Vicinamibacterales bacterium]
MFRRRSRAQHTGRALVQQHFGPIPVDTLVTAGRTFPVTTRVDLQLALERQFRDAYDATLRGVHSEYSHETLGFAHLVSDGHMPVVLGPLEHEEIDMGEAMPARCLKRGVWLARAGATPFAVILSPAERYGHTQGVHIEVAVPNDEAGERLSREFLEQVEMLVRQTGSYRGKVLSLEAGSNYSGQAGSVKVHRLPGVTRDDIILPEATLRLLERNVHGFIRQRGRLHELGLAVKKGLLFYGPPGTGKTHTIHYLASQLPDHTTLLITSEQVGLLDEYFQLARFLQPAMVVIEDVDLIARAREAMRGACEETLLNKLLNEMDGLREDAQLLFVLTTNRPDQLEAALASRPGRIDQAIEFPLPDREGRRRLVQLYSRGLRVPDDLAAAIVGRTAGASAAFIKELMRRAAQFGLEAGSDGTLREEEVSAALDEMLFSGGTLNVKLLGG